MEKYLNEINYDRLVENALKHVVIDALKLLKNKACPATITFISLFVPTIRGCRWTN